MALWAVELSEFVIQYRLRTAIKGQAVADFIAEFAQSEDKGEENAAQWNIHTDRSSNRRAGGAGVVIQTLEGDKIKCMIRLDFPTTNNEAEYEALVAGLDFARAVGAENVVVHCDSQVVISQVNGGYECKNDYANRLVKVALAEFMLVPKQVLSRPEPNYKDRHVTTAARL